jgi:deazaflavin-dependent oxidoreductase (nitroreductase family)
MAQKQPDHSEDMQALLSRLGKEEYCYVTTTGRVTGKPHKIEIWFGLHGHTLYLLSGGLDKSDWVKNLLRDPSVSVRIAKRTFPATARIVTGGKEETRARHLLAGKYQGWKEGKKLSEWARSALPVALDLIDERNAR